MCGRYYIATEEENIEIRQILDEINEKYYGSSEHGMMKTGEIFPTEMVPILTSSGNGRQARLMKWGYPRWNGKGVIINARAETAEQLSMFRMGIASRRCLVPASGFYEWRHAGKKTSKEKFLLRTKDTPLIYMAGIYDVFRDGSGNPYSGFSIITTAANTSMQGIHDRMPLIVSAEDINIWLHDERRARVLLHEACDAELELIAQ